MRSAKRSRLHAWPRSEQKHKEVKVKEQWDEMNKRITDLMKELDSDGRDRTVAVLDELQGSVEIFVDKIDRVRNLLDQVEQGKLDRTGRLCREVIELDAAALGVRKLIGFLPMDVIKRLQVTGERL